MKNVMVKVSISLETALAHGSAKYGTTDVQLTDADVQGLSEGARAELATQMTDGDFYPLTSDGETANYNRGPLDLDVADAAHVVAALEARVQLRAERRRQAAKKAEALIVAAVAAPDAEWINVNNNGVSVNGSPSRVYLPDALKNDPRIVARRKAPSLLAEVARLIAERAEKAAKRKQAEADEAEQIRVARQAIVSDHGTPDQRERFAAGVLPVGELEILIRSVLFAPLAECPPYVRKTADDIVHDSDDCTGDDDPRWVTREVEAPSLSSEQWSCLKTVRAAAEKILGATVDVTEHTAHLDHCSNMSWLAARVTVEFAGEVYKKSYAL